eukprot:510684-Hanusia_phi.AAC.1
MFRRLENRNLETRGSIESHDFKSDKRRVTRRLRNEFPIEMPPVALVYSRRSHPDLTWSP